MPRPPLLFLCCAVAAFIGAPLQAQDTCSCARDLEVYVGKVTRNYAGYRDKVNERTQQEYDLLVDSLRTKAASTSDKVQCFVLLDRYRSFFWDKHLQLSGDHKPDPSSGRPGPAPSMTTWTADRLEQHLAENASSSRPLEGIWQLETYRIGIVHNDTLGVYQGIILSAANPRWTVGMVKLTAKDKGNGSLQIDYWRGDLKHIPTTGIHDRGRLALHDIGTLNKTAPLPADPLSAMEFELMYGHEVQWRMLDDTTLYIKLGSCDLKNKAVLDSLVAANAALLARTTNWIVDFRGNGGGSTDVFHALLPYLYTRPMKDDGGNHWMSPENTVQLEAWYQQNKDRMDPRSARTLRKWVRYGTEHPNTWYKGRGGTLRFTKKHTMPERVAILADRGTASSGESFLLIARGISDKVVIFGENTGGYLDYGDLMVHDLGCDGLKASIPTMRLNRLDRGISYDREGVAPDVRIAPEVPEWIGVVRRYWAGSRATP